jgi:hypothetical protein
MALTGYFDDSGSSKCEPIYVIAGFVSSAEKWANFSIAWRNKLNEEPALSYFKMSEAVNFRGQFERGGWTPALRDQRVFELAEIITQHAMVRISSSVLRKDFDAFKLDFMHLPELQDPYMQVFYQLIFAVNTYQINNEGAECHLVFDDQGILGKRSIIWWNGIRDRAPTQERKQLLSAPPTFGNDFKDLALQAADMYAWLVRQRLEGDDGNLLCQAAAKQLREISSFHRELDRQTLLRASISGLVQRMREIGVI